MPTRIPDVPHKLVEAVAGRKAVLFAGAGISRGEVQKGKDSVEQYLPGWGDLLIVLVDRARNIGRLTNSEANKLKRAVKDQKFLFVAEAIHRNLGAREYDEALEDIFRSPRLKPTRRHILITEIPFAAILTTNYDKLLESAYALRGYIPPTYTFDNAPDIISALSHERFFILKAHGDIDRKDTIILSERDYRDVIYRQPGYRAALNTIFITKTILFIGTSLTDTDVKLVLESVSEAFGGKGPRHYALLPRREAGDSELQHWRDFFGIEILQYQASKGHPEMDEFLDVLKNKLKANKTGRNA